MKPETAEYYEPKLGVYIEESVSPLFNDMGEFTDSVHVMKDITERKKAEAEQQQLRDKAEMSSRLAAVGEMAASIAHEINNPLTGVIGFSELLMEKQDLSEDVMEGLKIINDGSQRVKDIVKRMLTFARQTKPVKTSTGIHELIDNTLEIRSYVLKTANIEVIKNYDPALPWVTVDPGQLQQVFLNLIVNAEHAMKKTHERGTLAITTEKRDDHIRISFRDDGPGMSPEVKAKLFQPFFTTKDPGEGTGLGLSLSRSIIIEHGGSIEVESTPGKGTRFIIMLPITADDGVVVQELTTGGNTSPENFRRANILVVDDEEAIRKYVAKILSQSGHTVDAYGNPEEALKKLKKTRYDIVLLDMRMPGMGGMEFYTRIKAQHPELAGKVIFITGDTLGKDIKDFLEKNSLPSIAKPFESAILLQKISNLL